MSDPHLKRIALVIAVVLAALAGSFYLAARPLSPALVPVVPSVAPVAIPAPLLPAAASSTEPKITWTPRSLTDQVATGQSKTLSVSFTSSETVSNVAVRVVPELQSFVQMSPSSFASIAKGQAVNLNVTLSASKSSPLGTFQGTIQLRLGSTLAKPLPVTIKVCRCVTDKGLSLSYPSDWGLSSDFLASGGPISLNTFDSAYRQGGIIPEGGAEITIVRTPLVSPLSDVIADNFPGAEVESTEPANVSGETATRVGYRTVLAPALVYKIVVTYVPHNAMLYKFLLYYHAGDPLESQFLTAFQEIMNTVQFTE